MELVIMEDLLSDKDDINGWAKVLKTCVEIVAKIADFQPNEILQLVVSTTNYN